LSGGSQSRHYGVYGAARTRAHEQDGLQLSATSDAHQRVITHYRQRPGLLHRAIGDNLRRLRRARNRADYDDQLDRPVALAEFAVPRARQVVAQLQALAPPPPAPNDASAPASPETTEEQ
jgi:hypothetical protein